MKPYSVDLILTDPPYGILESQSWDCELNIEKLEKTFSSILKPEGQMILFCNLKLLIRLMDDKSLFVKRSLHIWHKSSAMPINEYMPLPDYEFILVLKGTGVRTSDLSWHPKAMLPSQKPYTIQSSILKSPTRRHIKNSVSRNIDGKRWAHSVIDAPNKPNMSLSERSNHPSQKPELLLRQLIRGYSNPGDLVLDPFSGSGSTLISAYKEYRRSIGFEIEEDFYLEAKSRIENITNQQALQI
jgi:site-specific DNA-methyltransferase (adenine-specific)